MCLVVAEVGTLGRCESVDFDIHCGQLGVGDVTVEIVRDVVDFVFECATVLNQVFESEGLEREAHIHNFGWMPVAGGEVDESAFGEDIERTTILQGVARNALTARFDTACDGFEFFHIDLDIEVTGVGQKRVVLHALEVIQRNNVTTACGGDEIIAEMYCVVHLQNLKTVQIGLDGLDGVNLGDNDTSAHTTSAHGDAFAAVAIAGYDDNFTGN